MEFYFVGEMVGELVGLLARGWGTLGSAELVGGALPPKSKAFRLLFRQQLSQPESTNRGTKASARLGIPTWSATLDVKMRWKLFSLGAVVNWCKNFVDDPRVKI